MRKLEIALEVICCLLIILFFYTGVSKLIDHQAFEFDLINAPIIKQIAPIAYAGLPPFEIIVAFGLMFTKTRKAALIASLLLMIVFTVYVGGLMAFAETKPCTCGGVLRSMSWPAHLVFNVGYTIVAFIGLYLHKKIRKREIGKRYSEIETGPAHAL